MAEAKNAENGLRVTRHSGDPVSSLAKPFPPCVSRTGYAYLGGATYDLLPCGCRVRGNGTLAHPLTVELCDKHRRAEAVAHELSRDIRGTSEALQAALQRFNYLKAAAQEAVLYFQAMAGEDPGACLTAGSPEAEACDMIDKLTEAMGGNHAS